ncbi:pseudouridine synthase [Neptuniibacter sp. 2_MG-2023]|uniref:pseudouridine synthase n=1 Tax=Neptuniibacter sp. 2_MG-2023 TaxID=3062671 RepID=UPI0026E1E789|nr:pseudouridine synthase [Neptuniibacter sp. 2_MG-2023]MDO6514366.1 pseudouridine synthase [Neptuniibacter sp. 2_MG-2023]
MNNLNILFEDDDIIALNKPSGLLVHPSWIAPRGTPNLASMLKEYFNGGSPYTIHRLDRPTSGVILFGKNKEIAQKMNLLFAERKVEKTYLCMVRGYTPEADLIDYALKEELDKIADKHASKDKEAQEAVSEYRRLATVELDIPVGRYEKSRYSLVEVKPKTGRKHQIRRHMKHIFHPIIGDTNHGDNKHNKSFRENFDLQRLMLMASNIKFEHPVTQQMMDISAPVDQYTDQLFKKFAWDGLYLSEQTLI